MIRNSTKKYSFISADPVSEETGGNSIILYNCSGYLKVWKNGETVSYHIFNNITQKSAGIISFQLDGSTAVSPVKAPFGSLELFENVEMNILSAFIKFCLKQLSDLKIDKIIIKHYPSFYHPEYSNRIISAYIFNRFKIPVVDINHALHVDKLPFSNRVHSMEYRKLKKCQSADFSFIKHENTEFHMVFDRISEFRRQKKIPVNIDWGILQMHTQNMPARYQYFSVCHQERIIASTVAVAATGNILYNFLPGSDPEYNAYSPMVFLLNNLYNFCRENGFSVLDLGISSINNTPQSGLITFKERLGGQAYLNFTFELVL